MARLSVTVTAALVLVSSLGVFALVPSASAAHTFFDERIRSFDNTFLSATVFIPEGATTNSTPFVLMTHGWAGSRIATPEGRVLDLLNAGYGVVTWDSRGFGTSGGEVELNSPDYEVKDVSAIISYVVRRIDEAKLETPTDPVIGMSGGSYAGGIQLLSAAFDPRIDVIAPEITWNDLAQALGPNGVPKLAWTSALFGAGLATSCQDGAGIEFDNSVTTGCQTSQLAAWYATVHATNTIPENVRAELEYRSPKTYMSSIKVPTLLIQGFPDTLFDVNQAAANYAGIKANGAPVKLWLYDGGHALPGIGSVPNTQGSLISPTVIKWFDRHLKGITSVSTGPEVEYYLDGAWHGASAWPIPTATPRETAWAGIPTLAQAPITPNDRESFAIPLANGPLQTVGPVHVSYEIRGQGLEGYMFLSLGIRTGSTITRVDGQVQPTRGAYGTTLETDLVDVAASVPEGSTLVLVFGTSDPMYDGNRAPGFASAHHIDVDWNTL